MKSIFTIKVLKKDKYFLLNILKLHYTDNKWQGKASENNYFTILYILSQSISIEVIL